MPGQLWQECRKRGCDNEPVCSDCEYCDDHCHCRRRADDARQIAEFEKAYPGFLEKVRQHQEDGAEEKEGE